MVLKLLLSTVLQDNLICTIFIKLKMSIQRVQGVNM